jgi:hypothetical protein
VLRCFQSNEWLRKKAVVKKDGRARGRFPENRKNCGEKEKNQGLYIGSRY